MKRKELLPDSLQLSEKSKQTIIKLLKSKQEASHGGPYKPILEYSDELVQELLNINGISYWTHAAWM